MTAGTIRLDKWLWHARFFKSRTQASTFCVSGRVRVNGAVVNKAHYPLKPGDVLTFPKATDIRIIRIVELGARRGPATEARTLYEDLDPPDARGAGGTGPTTRVAERDPGSGRPTKAERRAIDRLRERE
jgi:ribosome-associated heat shock protein Hsp15